jgi:hypothetical protein
MDRPTPHHPLTNTQLNPLQVGAGMGVLVERCRYLEEAGCASICLNSCKVPTQVRPGEWGAGRGGDASAG